MRPQPRSADSDSRLLATTLDGNAAAGEFAGIFAIDPTSATVECRRCGAIQAFGQLHAYLGGPGTVLRCRECEVMVARVARTSRGTWLDLSGSGSWLLPEPLDPLGFDNGCDDRCPDGASPSGADDRGSGDATLRT